eukprot:CAMPEP_0202363696 /NCGR_PEP_ID=MMETSP1126-20121109/15385_1 /ASSEMBLY_ACC=CAM_ASM_000457 /TAXON_ID=3047 /ORGANISM="Dunaliella tertiolecta, Strain CCMP1320" /LENGTH=88 /DNA_ID=CAMNT_0048958159 /DNA_START=89 /DNA_END=356 /DNA_ORIENTATION=+
MARNARVPGELCAAAGAAIAELVGHGAGGEEEGGGVVVQNEGGWVDKMAWSCSRAAHNEHSKDLCGLCAALTSSSTSSLPPCRAMAAH